LISGYYDSHNAQYKAALKSFDAGLASKKLQVPLKKDYPAKYLEELLKTPEPPKIYTPPPPNVPKYKQSQNQDDDVSSLGFQNKGERQNSRFAEEDDFI